MLPFATICTYLQAAGRGQPTLHDTFIAITPHSLQAGLADFSLLLYNTID